MPGILELYTSYFNAHVAIHERKRTTGKISRAKIEFDILDSLDKASLPSEYKFSWYQAILTSDMFDAVWTSTKMRLQLRSHNTARFTPDISLRCYLADDDATASELPPSLTPDHGSRSSTPNGKEEEEEEEEEGAAWAAYLGRPPSPSPSASTKRPWPRGGAASMPSNLDSKTAYGGLGFATVNQEEGDDGAYRSKSSPRKKGKGKGKGAKTEAGVKKGKAKKGVMVKGDEGARKKGIKEGDI